MTDDNPRRSRTAWPGPMSIAGIEPGHEHELPAPLVQRIRLLTRAVVIFGVCLAAIGTLIVLVILQRGAARDREDAREEQRLNERFCEFLALAPDDHPLADDMRAELGCTQPGVAFADLPPAVQDQLAGRNPAVITPPAEPSRAVVPERDPMAGAVTDPPRPTPAVPGAPEPAPTPQPSPSPEPGPLVDLEPVTEGVCERLGVCL